jgi:hypothetical protein
VTHTAIILVILPSTSGCDQRPLVERSGAAIILCDSHRDYFDEEEDVCGKCYIYSIYPRLRRNEDQVGVGVCRGFRFRWKVV